MSQLLLDVQLTLMLNDWQNRGVLLWNTDTTTVTVSSSVTTYDLASSAIDALVVTFQPNSTSAETKLERKSFEEYHIIPNKFQTGRPTQYTVKRNLNDADIPFEDIEKVMKKVVKQRLQVTDDAVTFVAYNADNKYAPRVLQATSKQQLELDLNLANAESKAYSIETAGGIRLGDENTKIGTYHSTLPRRNVLVDGVLDSSQDRQFVKVFKRISCRNR